MYILFLPTFDGSPTRIVRAWREELATFFLQYPVAVRETVDIVVLHLEGEARDWLSSHLSHMRVSSYADFIQRLNKKFGRKKLETSDIETSPIIEKIVHEEPKEEVLIIT